MSLFLYPLIVGLIILVLGFILDGLLDIDGEGFITTSAIFITIFGATGFIVENIGGNFLLQLILSISLGLLFSLLFYFGVKYLKKSSEGEINEFQKKEEIIGFPVEIIHWSGNTGEVLVEFSGSRNRFLAKSNKTLGKDSKNKDFFVENIINDVLVIKEREI